MYTLSIKRVLFRNQAGNIHQQIFTHILIMSRTCIIAVTMSLYNIARKHVLFDPTISHKLSPLTISLL